jgi:protein-tyrosine phosphatase
MRTAAWEHASTTSAQEHPSSMPLLKTLRKGLRILVFRIRHQGIESTIQWMVGRGFPLLTGVPVFRYSEVTPQILVGPQFRTRGKRILENLGVHASVNLREEFDDRTSGLDLDAHCYLPTTDDHAPSMAHLFQGVNFIQREIAAGNKVYIHCAGGIGRAPTMAAAYFISQGDSREQALERIRAARPFINLSQEQMEQLDRFVDTIMKDKGRKENQPGKSGGAM